MKNENFFAMTNDEIFKKFQVDEDGLNSKEVEKRQEKYGLNTLPSKKKDSILKLFIDELKDPIVLLLIIAIILSFFIGEIIDAIAIILIITIDMIIGVFEEVKASNTIDSLQKLVPEIVKVIRNKKEIEIDSSELTLGDFVLLESGDKISADIRIIEDHNFTVDESILTGESISIVKNSKRLSNKKTDITSQSNIVFAGTSVVTGRAKGIVIRIGSNISTEPHISIYPNKAQLFIEGNALITTNYKANERVKLAFIVEPRTGISEELRNVVFIVNNGICERAAGWKDYQPSAFTSNSGSIKIGGTNSGIRVYGIRCYSKAITITNAYNNYVYDSDNKSTIVANNNIYTAGLIDIEKCRSKGDVIIIKGNLSKILDRKTTKDGSNSNCDIERICISDSSRNFTV